MIAVNMVVKDEEELLPGCLSSIEGLWDELVICDSGSSDRTIEIAKDYGAMVVRYQNPDFWPHEFTYDLSEARNMALGKTASPWVFIIDADERLHHPYKLRKRLLDTRPCPPYRIKIRFIESEKEKDAYGQDWRFRAFTRRHFYWSRPVHQVLLSPYSYIELDWSERDFYIEHCQKNPDDHFKRYGLVLASHVDLSEDMDILLKFVDHASRHEPFRYQNKIESTVNLIIKVYPHRQQAVVIARLSLLRLYVKQGRHEDGLELAKLLIKANRRLFDDSQWHDLRVWGSWCAAKAGDNQLAITFLEK